MLADKIEHYKKEKKMLRNTPASYKKEYPWLKEVDSLALANVQMHLESAFCKFFREPSAGFPRFKSKKSSRKSYTTNVVNGNIFLEGMLISAVHEEDGHEGLNFLMADDKQISTCILCVSEPG